MSATTTITAIPRVGSPPPARATIPVLRVRTAEVRPGVIWQVAAAAAPAMTLLGLARVDLAAWWLFGVTTLLLAYNIVSGRPREALAVAVSLTPCTLLLRNVFYYAAPLALMAAAIAGLLSADPASVARLRSNRPLLWFLAAAGLYWWASAIANQQYDSNIRVAELALFAAAVYLLGQRRGFLYTAFTGLMLATFAVAGGFLPYGTRLGEGAVGDIILGNPISLGLSACLVFLLTMTESGRWIFGAPHRYRRLFINIAACACLVMSTSRGSWLVAVFGYLIIFCLDRKSRRVTLLTLVFGALAVLLLLQSGRSNTIRKYFDMTTSAQSSANKITTGRADQWESFPRVFADSPLWGFGPGSAKSVSLRYTLFGKPWHSLYLHVGVELGLLGLCALAWLLITLLRQSWRCWRFSGEVVPLVGVAGFMLIGVSVTALDGISGIFLGLGFLGGEQWIRGRVRRATWSVASPGRRFS